MVGSFNDFFPEAVKDIRDVFFGMENNSVYSGLEAQDRLSQINNDIFQKAESDNIFIVFKPIKEYCRFNHQICRAGILKDVGAYTEIICYFSTFYMIQDCIFCTSEEEAKLTLELCKL